MNWFTHPLGSVRSPSSKLGGQGQPAEQAEQARPGSLVEVDGDYFLQNQAAMLRWKGNFDWVGRGRGDKEERQQEEEEAEGCS